jgi:purine-binding chemotaxis protein CheW
VTVHHGEGFEPELRVSLEADGWWYLLPVPSSRPVFTSHDAAAPQTVADLLTEADADTSARRVWESAGDAPGEPIWLVTSPDQQTGTPTAFFSNAPESITRDGFQRVLATHWPAASCAAQSSGTSLDVYRVRGWEGWHRHVTLAMLASAFRACLSLDPVAVAEAPLEAPAPMPAVFPVVSGPDITEEAVAVATDAEATASMDAITPDEIAPEIALSEPAVAELAEAEAIEIHADDVAAAMVAAGESEAMQSVPTTYRLLVLIEETDWRPVRAFQTLLVAQEAGEVLSSTPTRAEIERQEVGDRIEIVFESAQTVEQITVALEEVPEIRVSSLAAEVEAAAPAIADAYFDADGDAPTEEAGDPLDLLAALEAELSSRTVAREAGLASPTEEAADVVATRMIDAQQAIAKAEPQQELAAAANGAHAATNGGLSAAGFANGAVLTPIEPPAAPVTESPARLTVPSDTASVAPSAPVTPVAPSPAAGREPVNGSAKAKDKEPARIDEEQVIVLDVADESYGMPVQRVREIIRVPPITRVPNGPTFLEGVINLRGQVIPVLDLRKHLGVQATEHTRRSRVVVGELGDYTVGMVVDAVSQVVMVPASNVEPPPSLVSSAENGQVRGVARLGDRLVLLLDPDRVLSKR